MSKELEVAGNNGNSDVIADNLAKNVESKEFVILRGRMTLCLLVMTNGYLITGESFCFHKNVFDEAIGEKYALEDAMRKASSVVAYYELDKAFEANKPKEFPFAPSDYTSSKQVNAMQIQTMVPDSSYQTCVLVGQAGDKVTVDRDYMMKHKPKVGGYWLEYEEGYQSFSPKGTFEASHRLTR